MAQTAKSVTFGDFNFQEMVQVFRRCPEAVTFLFRGSDSLELGFGLEQCTEGQADNGGILLLKDVDVSKVASSSKLNAQAPVFKPPQQVLASILPGTASPAQLSEGAKSTTASPSSSSETTTSSADTLRHVVLEAEGATNPMPGTADNQLYEGHTRFEGGRSSQLGFQNVDPSIVTFVSESLIAANQSDGVQQTSPQPQDGSIEFLYELGSCTRRNSLSKGRAKPSSGARDAPSKATPPSSTFRGAGSPPDGQLMPSSLSPSLTSGTKVHSNDSGTKTPPLPTSGTKTPPLPTSGTNTPPLPTSGAKTPPLPTSGTKTPPLPTSRTKTPPLPTSGAKTPPLPTSGTKTPPLPTSGAKTPPLPTSGTKTPPLPTSGAKTPPLPTSGTKTPPLPTSGAKTPPLPTSGTKTPPLPTSGTKTPPLPTSGAKTPPLPTSGAKTPPLPTSGAKTPPLPTSGTKTPPLPTSGAKTPPLPTSGTKTPSVPTNGTKATSPTIGTKPPSSTSSVKVLPSSTMSTVNTQGAVDHTTGGQPSSADSSAKLPSAATPVAASAWSRPKDWGTVFGSSTAVGGGPRPLVEKPPESTSPPESGIADMHEGVEDRSSERSNPVLVQLGEKLKSLQVCYGEEVRLVPRGLVNTANLCYMHCILQMLLACPPLVNLLRSLSADPPPSSDPSPTPMLDCMVRFVHEFESADEYHEAGKRKRKSRSPQDFPKGTPIRPDYMYQVLDKTKSSLSRTVRGRQEDAQEFLGLVLDSLHEEMVAALSTVTHGPVPSRNKSGSLEDHPEDSMEEGEELGEGEEWEQVGWNNKSMVTRQTSYRESPISQVFGGELLSIVQKQGSKESATVEPFFALPLDIQDESVVTVQHALERLGTKEVLHDMYCSKTNTEVEASRKMTLSRLPPVLILHLKQFSFTSKGSQKLNKPIEYSMELEIPRDLLAQPVRKKVTVEQRKYRLSGVVYHHGLHAAGGHYTSDVRLAQCGGWFSANDTHLKPLAEEQVLKGQCKEVNKVAYLLCYRRSTE